MAHNKKVDALIRWARQSGVVSIPALTWEDLEDLEEEEEGEEGGKGGGEGHKGAVDRGGGGEVRPPVVALSILLASVSCELGERWW